MPPTDAWLTDGNEQCELCLGHFAYELEIRCVDCDLPLCPLCAVRVERRAWHCPGCAPEERR